jgi:hypothetical protein
MITPWLMEHPQHAQPEQAPPDGKGGKAAFPARRTTSSVPSGRLYLYLLCNFIYLNVTFVGKIAMHLVIFLQVNIFYAKE